MSEPIAWRTRWKNGSERDREWEMWTYRTEQPVPNDNQIIEALYAEPRSDRIEALEAALKIIAADYPYIKIIVPARAAIAPKPDK